MPGLMPRMGKAARKMGLGTGAPGLGTTKEVKTGTPQGTCLGTLPLAFSLSVRQEWDPSCREPGGSWQVPLLQRPLQARNLRSYRDSSQTLRIEASRGRMSCLPVELGLGRGLRPSLSSSRERF